MTTDTCSARTVDLDGISIAFDEAGDGPGTVLFVHGHPFDRSMWRPQLAALASAGWRVLAPDLRGYGRSAVVPGVTPMEAFAADLMGLLDRRGIDRAVVAGLSMGGQIAMECARLYPARVSALVLAATFPRAETVEGQQARRAMADRLEREGMSGYADETLPRMIAPASITALPDVAAHVLSMMRAAPPAGAAAALRGRALRPPYEDTLRQFDGPALIVAGTEDAFTTRADVDAMHGALAHSELVWMEGVGHMPNLERPEAFIAALLRFLRRVFPAIGEAAVRQERL
jgi:pimeloyl-ACP methyl ester carboxylesterase